MAEFNVNNLTGARGANPSGLANFDALLNIARAQLEKISSEVRQIINTQQFRPTSVTQEASGLRVQLPQLSNFISGQTDVLLKTALPLDRNLPVNVQVQTSNVVSEQGRPVVLRLEGQVFQGTAQPQRFTAEVPINNNNIQNIVQGNVQQTAPTADQVIRNFLPSNNINAFTNNLTEALRAALPQNLQTLNLTSQNNFNIQISSLVTPSGQQIVGNNTQLLPQVIQGQVEVFPDTNEALIRTEFGTFRTEALTNVPNGSRINFTIIGQATQTNITEENLLNLNPTNIQALRLSLESGESPLQNLLRILTSSQALAPNVHRFFPHPDDKAAYARQLIFLSGATTGNPEGWLSDDGAPMVNQIHDIDTNFNRLQEVFGVMRNFAGRGDQQISQEWSSYIIPFYDGNKLSLITLQVQRDPEGKEQQTTKGKKKFILELEQDDLGRTAIEGLYSKVQGKVNNLDIVLKTEKPVDDSFINELSAIYNDIATAYGFAGSISFAPFSGPTTVYTDISKILGDGIVI